jgi:hypothetical protein
VTEELRESSAKIAETHVLNYLTALPCRSWLGKKILEEVLREILSEDAPVELCNRLWSSLMVFDSLVNDASYAALIKTSHSSALQVTSDLAEACWKKLINLLVTVAQLTAETNPAYMRSPQFTTGGFMRMVFCKLVMVKEHKHRVIRCLNLIDSVGRRLDLEAKIHKSLFDKDHNSTIRDQ